MIVILDFGSQFSQLIARRVREANVYCELFPYDTPAERIFALKPSAIILSGGPNSVYDADAPPLPKYVLGMNIPVLGICYGMQLLAQNLGGHVAGSPTREYGRAKIHWRGTNFINTGLPSQHTVWASHGDKVESLPTGFRLIASTADCPIAAMCDDDRRIVGLQFHPEVNHTEHGTALIHAFLRYANIEANWTPHTMVDTAISKIRAQIGKAHVVAGVSGGVDSSVAAALVHRAVGDQLTCIYVDTGMMRAGESESVIHTFRETLGAKLVAVNAAEDFLDALHGVTDPEQKRKIIGEKFIRIFEREARRLADHDDHAANFLVQGTIYPDVIESRGPERQSAAKIKSHHNVGGLPPDLKFKLIEPLRYMFKDEVRAVGTELGLPDELVWRQPFPGPGLAVRCLGELNWERLERLRAADKILTDELQAAGLIRGRNQVAHATSQAFVVLLPVRSVGVMGDGRTYQECCAIRAVTTDDFMTADWAKIPYDVLGHVSSRIVNEVAGINRVVYDITSKPPATIEWE
jgi:GMP synthase (glutamine-hydrolysing)